MSSLKLLGLQRMSFSLTRREWLTLACVSSVCFTTGIGFSLQGPIYPQEASKKGAKAWEYGLVFGVFELVNFIVCPIYGKYMDRLGTKFLVVAGMTLGGCSSILFGFLHEVDSLAAFISLSFVLRIMEAVGTSAAFTASFAATALEFKASVATVYAINECFFGLGFTLGPIIGGYLFQVGGFLCPFLVVGVMMIIVALVSILALTDVIDQCPTKEQGQIWTAMKLEPVLLDLFSVFSIHFSLGFYLATLETHLRQFALSPVHVGSIFTMDAVTYLLTTPLVGRLCDTTVNPKGIILLGTLLVVISFSLIGPLPFLPLPTLLWMVYLGMVLHGLAISCIMVPAFMDAIRSAVECGMADDLTTYGLITGLCTSAVALGAFVGPTIAGMLFDTLGFRYGSLVVIAVFLVLFLLMTWFVCVEMGRKRQLSYCQFDNSRTSDMPIANTATATEYGSTRERAGTLRQREELTNRSAPPRPTAP